MPQGGGGIPKGMCQMPGGWMPRFFWCWMRASFSGSSPQPNPPPDGQKWLSSRKRCVGQPGPVPKATPPHKELKIAPHGAKKKVQGTRRGGWSQDHRTAAVQRWRGQDGWARQGLGATPGVRATDQSDGGRRLGRPWGAIGGTPRKIFALNPPLGREAPPKVSSAAFGPKGIPSGAVA